MRTLMIQFGWYNICLGVHYIHHLLLFQLKSNSKGDKATEITPCPLLTDSIQWKITHG